MKKGDYVMNILVGIAIVLVGLALWIPYIMSPFMGHGGEYLPQSRMKEYLQLCSIVLPRTIAIVRSAGAKSGTIADQKRMVRHTLQEGRRRQEDRYHGVFQFEIPEKFWERKFNRRTELRLRQEFSELAMDPSMVAFYGYLHLKEEQYPKKPFQFCLQACPEAKKLWDISHALWAIEKAIGNRQYKLAEKLLGRFNS